MNKYFGLIVTVDDEKVNTLLLANFLECKGYRVIEINDSSKAIDIILNVKPNIILLDINMPKINGFELLKALKVDNRISNIPVIMVSGSSSNYNKIESARLGAKAFILKPVNLKLLESEIEKNINI